MTTQIFQNPLAFRSSLGSSRPQFICRGALPVRDWTTGWFKAFFAAFRSWRARSQSRRSLSSMSDRELRDIGLTRCDLDRVFDTRFNADLMFAPGRVTGREGLWGLSSVAD